MALYVALSGHKCQTHLYWYHDSESLIVGPECQIPLGWYQDGESLIVGPELVQQNNR